jgi:type IV pilus assembly protein PilQ
MPSSRTGQTRRSNGSLRGSFLTAALLASLSGAADAVAQNTTRSGTTPGAAARNARTLKPSDNIGAQTPDGIRDPMAPAGGDDNVGTVRVTADELVDIHVNDEDLAAVLQMLSIQSQKNIVASKNVSARVTANLYGVTFKEALNAILEVNGFGFQEQGNFIKIYTQDELREMERSQQKKVNRVFRLNYLNATDAGEFVKALLSENGQIKVNGKTTPFPGKSDVPVGADEFALDSTMVVTDFEENVNEIAAVIKEIDTRPAQVLVEATILQTALSEDNAFGVDFALLNNLDFNSFVGIGGPLKVVDGLIVNNSEKLSEPSSGDAPARTPGQNSWGVTSTPGGTTGPATIKAGLISGDVGVFVKMLDQVTDTTVLSNPKILALNRQPARVLVGKRVGYLNTTSTDTATTQTVEFLATGTQLHFRPFISGDGNIRLELKPQVSEATIRDVKNSTGNVVTVPDELTNELTTNVIVRDGQTVVLGGLFTDKTVSGRKQVPLLGDIPLLGAAFRGNSDAVIRDEIIFLITPSIISDAALAAQGERGLDSVERARTGARDGLLFFSRERLTAQKNIEAQRLAAEGNSDKALWKLDQSLSINPRQPDAIALRETIAGEAKRKPSRSILEGIINGEAKKKADAIGAPADAASGPQSFNSATPIDPATGRPVRSNASAAPLGTAPETTDQAASEVDASAEAAATNAATASDLASATAYTPATVDPAQPAAQGSPAATGASGAETFDGAPEPGANNAGAWGNAFASAQPADDAAQIVPAATDNAAAAPAAPAFSPEFRAAFATSITRDFAAFFAHTYGVYLTAFPTETNASDTAYSNAPDDQQADR